MKDNQKVLMATLIVCSFIAIGISFYDNLKINAPENIDKKIDIEGIEISNDYYKYNIDNYRIAETISKDIESEDIQFIMSSLTKYNFYINNQSDKYEGSYLYENNYKVDELSNEYKLYTALNSIYQSNLLTETTKEEYDKYKALEKVSGKEVEKALFILFGSPKIDKKSINWLASLKVEYNEKNDIYYLISNDIQTDKKNKYIVTKTMSIETTDDTYIITEAVAFVNSGTNKVYKDYTENNLIISLEYNKTFEFNNNENEFDIYKYIFKKDDKGKYHFKSIEKI